MSPDAAVLIVAPAEVAGEIRKALADGGLAFHWAATAADGYKAARRRPAAAVIHSRLPDMDGFAFARLIRRDPLTATVPLLMTGEDPEAEVQRVDAFESGADAYLERPFEPRLALATMRALLRRSDRPSRLRQGGIALDLDGHTALVRGRAVDLTPKEFDLLAALLRRPGRVLTAGQLLESVWRLEPGRLMDPHIVQVHVASLRRKIGDSSRRQIVNVFGRGYKFDGRRPLSSARRRSLRPKR